MENQNGEVSLTRTEAKVISGIISLINKNEGRIDKVPDKKWNGISKDAMKQLVEKNPEQFMTFKGELWTFLDTLKHEKLHGSEIGVKFIGEKSNSPMNQMVNWIPKLFKH
jgi:hypothetical protein